MIKVTTTVNCSLLEVASIGSLSAPLINVTKMRELH